MLCKTVQYASKLRLPSYIFAGNATGGGADVVSLLPGTPKVLPIQPAGEEVDVHIGSEG